MLTTALTRDQQDIQEALIALRTARIVAERSPTTKNLNTVTAYEDILNGLLELRGTTHG